MLRLLKVAEFSPAGWQIVAGGRSEAQTTGKERLGIMHPGGVPLFSDTRAGCGIFVDCCPVVCASLRPPATICQPFRLTPATLSLDLISWRHRPLIERGPFCLII